MKTILSAINLEVERIEAVDGTVMSEDELKGYVASLSDISKIICPRALSSGEVGAFLSHRKCWEKLVNSKENWALIMEDDIQLSSQAKNYLSNSDWIPNGLDVIQLFVFRKRWKAKVDRKEFRITTQVCLQHPYKPSPIGAQAYFISRKAAEEALRLGREVMAPVDEFLFNPISDFARNFPVYRLNPAVVMPLDERFRSTIGVKRELYPYLKIIRYHPIRYIRQFQYRMKAFCFGREETFTYIP